MSTMEERHRAERILYKIEKNGRIKQINDLNKNGK
jgi:hypothetical protein